MIKWITKELFWFTVFAVILYLLGILKNQDQFLPMMMGWFAVSLVLASINRTPKAEE